MPNLPPPLVLIMRRYCELFHIPTFTVQRTVSSLIMIFPIAKLQTLHFVGFYQYYIKMHLHFSDPLDQTFSETFHSLEGV